MEKTYYIEAARHEINEYTVESSRFRDEDSRDGILPAYQQMVDWMKDQLQLSENGRARVHKFTPEYNPERDMNIINLETRISGPHYRVIPDSEIVLDADEPFQEIKPQVPFEAKGYSLWDDAYFFASVDTLRTVKPYKAESPEQALQMAKGDQLHNVLTQVQPIRQFLHADKYDKVTLQTGQTVDIVGEREFQKTLKERFPDGLTVRLADESFANLDYFKRNADDFTSQPTDWMGLANPGEATMLAAHGNIPAELHLKPEDYKYVFACDDTYYDEDMSNLFENVDLVCSSLLLANEPKLEAMRVKVAQMPVMVNRLYVAGKPFTTAMQMAEDFHVRNDQDFKFMLDKIYMHSQPEWIKQLAEQKTMQQRHKAFINITATASGEAHQAYSRLLAEAVKKFGYGPVQKLLDAIKQPSTVPDAHKEKAFRAVTYVNREMEPYQKAQQAAFEKYERTVKGYEAEFARKFNDFIDRNVKEVTMYPNNQGKWHVRLQINGEQQMGRPIEDKDARIRKDANGQLQNIRTMACKYFKDEIFNAMTEGQQQSRTMHR